jgi:hypothetical protein
MSKSKILGCTTATQIPPILRKPSNASDNVHFFILLSLKRAGFNYHWKSLIAPAPTLLSCLADWRGRLCRVTAARFYVNTSVLEPDTKKVVKHAVLAELIVVILGLQHSHDGVEIFVNVYTASDGIFVY